VPAALPIVAACVFAAMAWRRWRPPVIVSRPAGRVLVPRRDAEAMPSVRKVWRRIASQARGFPLGVALGFLPCGFLYAALLTAAASGDPWTAAAGMAAFGAGTVPALVAIGIAGHAAGRRWRGVIASVAPFILVANAALLALLAIRGLLA
jgi:sulfite exporter TauE/SafE